MEIGRYSQVRFKGIDTLEGNVIEGEGYFYSDDKYYICANLGYDEMVKRSSTGFAEIKPKTLCNSFGLFDLNGKELFTKDIIKIYDNYAFVAFDKSLSSYVACDINDWDSKVLFTNIDEFEIVGSMLVDKVKKFKNKKVN